MAKQFFFDTPEDICMAANDRNKKNRNDPHRDLHASGPNAGSNEESKRRVDDETDSPSTPMQGKDRSTGGSQGASDETRNASSANRSSGSSREGGYGGSSGYSEGSRGQSSHGGRDTQHEDPDSREAGSRSANREAGSSAKSTRSNQTGQTGQPRKSEGSQDKPISH